MNLAAQFGEILNAMSMGVAIHDLMRSNERKAGYRVVVPGDVPWLSREDWDNTVVVSIDKNRVRLVAILARNPGSGAFRRTIDGIRSAKLIPVVVEPTLEMQATLKRWGWRGRRVGNGTDVQTVWYEKRF